MRRIYRSKPRSAFAKGEAVFAMLAVLVTVSFLLGGSARADVASLLVLRPLALVLLATGLVTLRTADWEQNRFILGMAGAVILLPLLQLIPLPADLWQTLPGRSIIAEIDKAAGLGKVSRPITMTPFETKNAMFALSVPLAVIVLGVQLSGERLRHLLYLVLGLGALSALLGLLQTLSSPTSALYLYRLTNNGSAVGLFANRNHQAFLLATMIPMLAYAAASRDGVIQFRWLMAALGGLILLPLILITGSRSGLVLAAFALLVLPFLVLPVLAGRRIKGQPANEARWPRYLLIASGMGLIGLTALLGRALAWQRLGEETPFEDMRFKILPTMWNMIDAYLPLGSGLGSFERVYQIHEPDALLAPFYMNHAHNDWLELLMTGGVPALLIAAVASGAFVFRVMQVFGLGMAKSGNQALARTGLVVVLLAGFASISDYPLRTPAGSAMLAIAVLWANLRAPEADLAPLAKTG